MEKIEFVIPDTLESEEFYVLEQTKINEVTYLLVADSEDGEGVCLILKDSSKEEELEALYEEVEDEEELNAVLKVFEELLEDVSIER
ncbi:hypothetical protein M2454_001305 [Aequitasia blattaphilus]|uniref:DUF1292 domain-containing protein n=1 Tax=Aequitasia blattaphilus TaxID=2949332 RepID=A0ABT1E7G3_9FIRM|nr:DUF1292 domain-containing protein [Aequitasia blattaphilus]MCP1101773.1 DUF1292 domain-containing protein [Aequitasia blattaphilus]MCR8614413.1 DUF1292 domain-containing protein [Aequitasia blattaphilus]